MAHFVQQTGTVFNSPMEIDVVGTEAYKRTLAKLKHEVEKEFLLELQKTTFAADDQDQQQKHVLKAISHMNAGLMDFQERNELQDAYIEELNKTFGALQQKNIDFIQRQLIKIKSRKLDIVNQFSQKLTDEHIASTSIQNAVVKLEGELRRHKLNLTPGEKTTAALDPETNLHEKVRQTSIGTTNGTGPAPITTSDYLLLLVCFILFVFGINCFVIGGTRIRLMNQAMILIPQLLGPTLKLHHATCAMGMVGGGFGLLATLAGLMIFALKGSHQPRFFSTIAFITCITGMSVSHLITIITASIFWFKQIIPDKYTGISWILIGSEFLIIFHGSILILGLNQLGNEKQEVQQESQESYSKIN